MLQSPRQCFAGSLPRPGSEDDICDPLADYYLGMEDYPEAIRRHQIVIQEHPERALAYYHLGFAYGVIGNHQRELADYQKAVELGLSDWELFLNMGLLYTETNHLDDASAVLRLAALLGPYHPETHFNLGLVYERLGIFQQAEQEILLSLRLDPGQVDARNTLGLIYAEEGNYQRAQEEWSDLASSNPDFTPARANLAILSRVERGRIEGPKHLSGFAHAP
jgi:tetratricopeptide (TPR) repeat protein